ncbi:MAG: lipopolysaccharide kinase InaA family protein [Candidatus Binatus sp.]|uniref:lipopolysaccharide kinase InaA family protein n=1 Tax=Candidatus Binatus sp. TaxID=2811406 RepID=UPI00271DE49D|nr:lipopolysaccharide kinase InaA family protein [Candidatus Binatus sp.]MDO8434911.1 lipopolysaccharide kinase InaA family protein [Candidatus Binatus sp.]
MRTVLLYARSPEWGAAILRADELLRSATFRAVKSEGRTLAGFVDIPGVGSAFIKRVETAGWINGFFLRLRRSRAARSIAGAAMLRARGIAHPEPLAALDCYQRGAICASYLLSTPLLDADSLSRFALGPGGVKARDVRRRKRISDAVAADVRRLHQSGLYTRDLQETNLMVADDGGGGFKIHFIDLEDFRSAGTVSRQRRLMNLVHLDRSIGRFLCRAARLDFLYAYLGRRPGRSEARRIVAEVLAMRARVDRRKQRHLASSKPIASSEMTNF